MRGYLQSMGFARASALLWLACLPGALAAELPVALGPLQIPDMPNAKVAVANLTKLAAARSGAAKAQAERLACVIKNLFAAECHLAEAVKAGRASAAEARWKESNSAAWMRPNLLGRVNEQASREALIKATAIKLAAERRVTDAQQNLVEQLRDMDCVLDDFYKLQEFEVVLVLVETSAVVASRSLPKDLFTTAFPPAAVANASKVLRQRRIDNARR
jgi:hypothetical protein